MVGLPRAAGGALRGLTGGRLAARDRDGALASLAKLGLPVFIKPANLGSSIGIERSSGTEDLAAALDYRASPVRSPGPGGGRPDRARTEVAVCWAATTRWSAWSAKSCLPGNSHDFQDKYRTASPPPASPADLPAGVRPGPPARPGGLPFGGCLRHGPGGFLPDRASGRLFLKEINFIPGFTSISMYPKMMEASGWPIRPPGSPDRARDRPAPAEMTGKNLGSRAAPAGSNSLEKLEAIAHPGRHGREQRMDCISTGLGLGRLRPGRGGSARNVANLDTPGYQAEALRQADVEPGGARHRHPGKARTGQPRGSNVDLATEAVNLTPRAHPPGHQFMQVQQTCWVPPWT